MTGGFAQAFARLEAARAAEDARRENERATVDLEAARDAYGAQWDNARRAFRERRAS